MFKQSECPNESQCSKSFVVAGGGGGFCCFCFVCLFVCLFVFNARVQPTSSFIKCTFRIMTVARGSSN